MATLHRAADHASATEAAACLTCQADGREGAVLIEAELWPARYPYVQPSLFDAPAAQLAAERGMEQAERNADAQWRWRVEQGIRQLARSGRVFSSDDVWELVGEPPSTTHPNALGSVFNRLARQGVIRMVGYTNSQRVRSHRNLLRTWAAA